LFASLFFCWLASLVFYSFKCTSLHIHIYIHI
jgi:hypothetical protein